MIIIMRGIPGSGKSHWAKIKLKRFVKEQKMSTSGLIVSADDYRIRDGKYFFDPKETDAAHKHCYGLAYVFLASHEPSDLLIVDNTNIANWEFTPYVQLGKHHGHEVIAVQMQCRPEVAYARNEHGVPLSTITRMCESFEVAKTISKTILVNSENRMEIAT